MDEKNDEITTNYEWLRGDRSSFGCIVGWKRKTTRRAEITMPPSVSSVITRVVIAVNVAVGRETVVDEKLGLRSPAEGVPNPSVASPNPSISSDACVYPCKRA